MRALLAVAIGCALASCTKSGGANDLAAPDATLACPPLASYCDQPLPWAPCAPTLADARAHFCPPDGGVKAGRPAATTADCAALRVVSVVNVDYGEHFYYDAVTGALVAVVAVSANFGGSSTCEGGPATFAPPRCQPSVPLCD